MKKLLVLSAMLIVSLMLVVQLQAQQRVRSVSVGGTPLLPDNLVNGPVPRLPDGHPDLTGPWMGGGSNADIEADGGSAVYRHTRPETVERRISDQSTQFSV